MQSKNKPVAWVIFKDGEITHAELSDGSGVDMDLSNWTPLYTSIPTAKSGLVTREGIIRMAREAELGVVLTADESVDGEGGVWLDADVNYITQIERFANLVAAAERDSMIKDGWRRCAVGQRTTQFCAMLEDAVKAEREACEKLAEPGDPPPCDCESCGWDNGYEIGAHEERVKIHAAIRARGEK